MRGVDTPPPEREGVEKYNLREKVNNCSLEVSRGTYSTEPRRGEVDIFHQAPTLKGTIVLV